MDRKRSPALNVKAPLDSNSAKDSFGSAVTVDFTQEASQTMYTKDNFVKEEPSNEMWEDISVAESIIELSPLLSSDSFQRSLSLPNHNNNKTVQQNRSRSR